METKAIRFSEIEVTGHNAVLVATTFPEDFDWDELNDFLMNDLGFSNKPVIAVRRILDNVLGDEGRADWLLEFPEDVVFNPIARLRFSCIKWTEDFICNYHRDFYGMNPYMGTFINSDI